MNFENRNFLFVLFACLLWGIDLFVRYPITLKMGFESIVFFESFIGFLFILPWIISSGHKELRKFKFWDWCLGIFIGGIGLTVAGYLTTLNIHKGTPGTFAFFQIFQPFFVMYAARIFLKESGDKMYFFWGVWIVFSGVMMFSQDLGLLFKTQDMIISDILIALLTMLIWGLCTIAAKLMLHTHSPMSLLAVRWGASCIFSTLILFLSDRNPEFELLLVPEMLMRFLFIGGIAGVMSMYCYYTGLKSLPASKVSFVEISFSAFGMMFSSIYTFEGLTFLQSLGALSFFSFIFLITTRESSQISRIGAG